MTASNPRGPQGSSVDPQINSAKLVLEEALYRLEHDKPLHIEMLKRAGTVIFINWPGSADNSFKAARDGHYRKVTFVESGIELQLSDWKLKEFNHRASLITYLLGHNGQLIGLGNYCPMLATLSMQLYRSIDGRYVTSLLLHPPAWAAFPDKELYESHDRELKEVFRCCCEHHRSVNLPKIIANRNFWT